MQEHAARGRALVLVGALALLRALTVPGPPPSPYQAGSRLSLRPEQLQGQRFRLLPGVGPVLAGRLEAARLAAGGVLLEADLASVRGVGAARLERWRALWGAR